LDSIKTFYEKQHERHKQLLLAAGFQEMAVIDFYDAYVENLNKILDGKIASSELLLKEVFQEPYMSNAIVVYLRFLTSAHLKKNDVLYEPFLEDNVISIDDFCSAQVEAMDREADELQLIALTKTMERIVKVAYLNASEGDLILHPFFPDDEKEAEKRKPILLLYRPGHYDILY
jgi:ubiquitin thioesterase protein OTUB1